MRVADLRQRVLKKAAEVADSGDEAATAVLLGCIRALLIALALRSPDEEVNVQELAVGTSTAARILGLHPEYIRELVRRDQLQAQRENGELRIPISDLLSFMVRGQKMLAVAQSYTAQMQEMLLQDKGSMVLWQRPPQRPQAEK